jgi:hypothetical protein
MRTGQLLTAAIRIRYTADPCEPSFYFTRELSGLSNELERAGLQVYEALAISEVFYLAEQNPIDHTVQDDAAQEVAQHHVTLQLKPEATAADVIWAVSGFSPDVTLQ